MPIPQSVARVNRAVTNRVTRQFAGHVPGFAIVIHEGRKSGTEFRTPLNAFAANDGFAIALTYGPESDWVKNVLAAGGCALEYRGQTIRLSEPRLSTVANERKCFPALVRFILGLVNVEKVLVLSRTVN